MILALETSTPRASLALLDDGEIIWEIDFTTRRSHNSKIFSPVEEALRLAGNQLKTIVVGVGPGSYSGVRVGISVANGLGIARGIPVIGLSSLAAFPAGDCTLISDARRQTYAVAVVKNRKLVGEPDLVAADDFRDVMEKIQGAIVTPDQSVADDFESIMLQFPTAGELAKIAATLSPEQIAEMSAEPVEPHYLRAPFITVAKKKPSFRK